MLHNKDSSQNKDFSDLQRYVTLETPDKWVDARWWWVISYWNLQFIKLREGKGI